MNTKTLRRTSTAFRPAMEQLQDRRLLAADIDPVLASDPSPSHETMEQAALAGEVCIANVDRSDRSDTPVDGTQTASIMASAEADGEGLNTMDVTDGDTAQAGVLDVTGNGNANPFQDGVLVVRFMLGQSDADLEDPALIPAGATRTTGAAIRAHLEAAGNALDVNGDGVIDPSQDGILITRYLLGQPDANLEDSALIPEGSTRTTGAAIRKYLETMMPSSVESELPELTSSGTAEEESISPAHNPADVNGDGLVTRQDAQDVIDEVMRQGSGQQYDLNGDGLVTPRDALFVINRLSSEPLVSAKQARETGSSATVDRLLSDQEFLNDLSQTQLI